MPNLNDLTRAAELKHIDLVGFQGERANPVVGGPLQAPDELTFRCKIGVGLPNTFPDGSISFVTEANVVWEGGDGEIQAAVTIILRLAYDLRGEGRPTDDIVNQFATQVVVHHAWPFIRERLRTMSADLGLPPLVLPVRHHEQIAGKLIIRPSR